MALLAQFVKLGHLLADIIAHVQFAFRGDHLIVLQILQGLLAKWIVADNLATLRLMLLDVGEPNDGRTVRALDPERVDYLLDDARRSPDLDIKMAHRAVLVHDQPILDAQLAVQLVAVVALLRVSAHFEANLAEQVVCESLVDLEDRD